MSARHTFDPWYARQVHADGFVTHVVSLDAEPVEDEYHYGRNIAKDLSGDHAALIAAAPELLAVCKQLIKDMNNSDSNDEVDWQDIYDKAAVAIRKATGE